VSVVSGAQLLLPRKPKPALVGDYTLGRSLTGRKAQIQFTVLFAFGAGLWLQWLHDVEGGIEPGAPPPVLHWLRDSSLAVPLVALGVVMGATLARGLLDRYGGGASDRLTAAFVVALVATYASVTMAVGNPIHGFLFEAHEAAGHDLPLLIHLARDGLMALSANAASGCAVVVIFVRRRGGR
jgi:hypothetical protein